MQYISLPDNTPRRLSFYLAMEEYVAAAFQSGFFIWTVRPTVIIGRNQDLEAEVNLPFCRENGIDVIRRHSGGGCVYSDPGNLMLSWVTERSDVRTVFSEFMDRLGDALRALGFPAVTTEHNDVLIDGHKVSGNAFCVHPNASIVHGTLLYDTDFSVLEKAITPSQEKLGSHGVKSVRQRVANLKALGLEMPQEELIAYLRSRFATGTVVLDSKMTAEVEEIEKGYLDPAFILGKNRK